MAEIIEKDKNEDITKKQIIRESDKDLLEALKGIRKSARKIIEEDKDNESSMTLEKIKLNNLYEEDKEIPNLEESKEVYETPINKLKKGLSDKKKACTNYLYSWIFKTSIGKDLFPKLRVTIIIIL